jgi:hypothetical protein
MKDKNKYYEGSELKWSIVDVFRVAEQNDIKGISKDDAETILHHTFEDNEAIMQFINEEIQETIETFLNQNK